MPSRNLGIKLMVEQVEVIGKKVFGYKYDGTEQCV